MSVDTPRKAVILARGLGSRMRKEADGVALDAAQARAADAGVKAMISVGRPFLDHVISALADAGFTDVCLVIGPEHGMIRDYYDGLETSRVTIHYAVQAEPRGTADALLAAEEFAGEDRILVINSDNYYPAEALRMLADAPGSALVGFDRAALVAGSNIPADRIAAFALATVDAEGNLAELGEKPDADTLARLGGHALVSMNCWLCSPAIFPAARAIEPSARGEYEITDAVRRAIADGDPYRVVRAAVGVLDMSSRGDISSVVAALGDREVRL
ncbi:glucose-1-phosphate thymidylyltransferase [Tessaracoccus lapidicaptus]|uniref:Glucose-1-phosphate thymidylyltransferase n=1 Tax=Tessaracoccus lapidicaptus TaxID=1427523 RepID=A0A1C0AHA9_9ACTN|nr:MULTISPECIES: nucleotidyltransferase family protein [Tessaracoccus]AQX16496.1 glucose-1-phosphate thymidylyltransferase [Tessaracoccus sp. T2.5-30]OCL31405.1 glucose-1-phosphate thymidylyltransferase [Tessaracoccus lapidicaptus]VEP41155.1 UTP--glucose-1-phosphate uridylyltransferase [Tessaracoccus lapidicaptus]